MRGDRTAERPFVHQLGHQREEWQALYSGGGFAMLSTQDGLS
jgi:hypothetical protein